MGDSISDQSQLEMEAENVVTEVDELLQGVVEPLETTFFEIWLAFIGHIPYLLAGLVMLLMTIGTARFFRRAGTRLFRDRKIRQSLKDLIVKLIIIVIWVVGLLLTAMMWFPGLTPTSALGGLGLLSIAVGFAFQDIFENFFAGVLLLWQFPFENGDFIECEGVSGSVQDINIRMTEIRQTTGELILVPDSLLFKNPVTVLTNRDRRRMSIICGIGYNEDVEAAIKVMSTAVSDCSSTDSTKPVQCFPCEFNASSVDIEVTWWTNPKPGEMRQSRGEVIGALKRALDGAGIEIPFPQGSLTFNQSVGTES